MELQTLFPEILVIGAGPGGAAAAWSLARDGHDVLMIDRSEFPRDKTCGDGLTPMAVSTLRSMEVLNKIAEVNPSIIERVRMVGPFGAEVDLAFRDYMPDSQHHALVLPREAFDDILRRHALAAGASFMGHTTVEEIEMAADRVNRVVASSPDGKFVIEAKQVVIAVGANIGLLRRCGFLKHKPLLIRASRGYFSGVDMPANRYDFFLIMSYYLAMDGSSQLETGERISAQGSCLRFGAPIKPHGTCWMVLLRVVHARP